MSPDLRNMTSSGSQGGLTLLELVVVLAILSVLGTVMLTQTAGLTNEARYQQTIRTLEDLEVAVLGRRPMGAEDPTGVLPGFISDMGRLPASDGLLPLAELWDAELFDFGADDLFFRPRAVEGLDDGVQLLCGWRGPYVRLPIGSDQLRDGWGGDFLVFDRAGALLSTPGPIGAVASDGPGVGGPFDPPVGLGTVFADQARGVDPEASTLPLDGLIVRYALPGTSIDRTGIVRLYGVVNGEPALLVQSENFSVPSASNSSDPQIEVFDAAVQFDDSESGSPIVSIATVKGPKILVAYQLIGTEDPSTDPNDATADLTGRVKSVVRFTVPAGGLNALPSPITLVGE
ncbi:MAG: prepilin-type N-terminal cleavage/methylation domain-containing protein [Planctomycetota bacterium]